MTEIIIIYDLHVTKCQPNLTEIVNLTNLKSSVDNKDNDRESIMSVSNESTGDLASERSVDLRNPSSASVIDEVSLIILRHCI